MSRFRAKLQRGMKNENSAPIQTIGQIPFSKVVACGSTIIGSIKTITKMLTSLMVVFEPF